MSAMEKSGPMALDIEEVRSHVVTRLNPTVTFPVEYHATARGLRRPNLTQFFLCFHSKGTVLALGLRYQKI